MGRIICIVIMTAIGLSGRCFAQATRPAGATPSASADSTGSIEFRATQALAAGKYAEALPLFQQVAAGLGNQPDRLSMIQEEIRVCQKNLAMSPVAIVSMQSAGGSGLPSPMIPGVGSIAAPPEDPTQVMDPTHRLPHVTPKPGQTLEIEIKALGNFLYDPAKGGDIPSDVLALNGAKIRSRGFMMPLDQVENITSFAFVPSLFGCCYGQPPQIQHTIVVRTPPGKSVAKYTSEEMIVEGTLHVVERKDDGFIISIFEMDATSIRPAPQQ